MSLMNIYITISGPGLQSNSQRITQGTDDLKTKLLASTIGPDIKDVSIAPGFMSFNMERSGLQEQASALDGISSIVGSPAIKSEAYLGGITFLHKVAKSSSAAAAAAAASPDSAPVAKQHGRQRAGRRRIKTVKEKASAGADGTKPAGTK